MTTALQRREKKLREAENTVSRLKAKLEASNITIAKTVPLLMKMERSVARQRLALRKARDEILIAAHRPKVAETPKVEAPKVDDAIPDFLKRAPVVAEPAPRMMAAERPFDPYADQHAERKKIKARGRIAKMKAKRSGEAAKMPLTGRAALAAIRG